MTRRIEDLSNEDLLEKAYHIAVTARDFSSIRQVLSHKKWPKRMNHFHAACALNPRDPEFSKHIRAMVDLDLEIMEATGQRSGEIRAASFVSTSKRMQSSSR